MLICTLKNGKKELTLGRLAAILYDDVIIYAVPAEPIDPKALKSIFTIIDLDSTPPHTHAPQIFT